MYGSYFNLIKKFIKMLKCIIFILVIYVTASFGSDFEKKFTRLINENLDPAQKLYGSARKFTARLINENSDPEQKLYGSARKFTARLINENSDPEQKLYGSAGYSNDGIILTFTQKLDHFKSTNKVTWEQRVFVLNKYYEKSGPFLLYLFGNEEASMDWLRQSQIMSYAKDFKGLVIGFEHRYYGESRPFQNTSLHNLGYFNIRQALADVAYLIETVKGIPGVPENTKWILFGGFYGGSLAAWARKQYPHLVHGAVASSAIVKIQSENPEYLEHVKNTYYSNDLTCGRHIESAFQLINETASSEGGRNNVSKLFKLCSLLENNEEDIAHLQEILVFVVSSAVENDQHSSFSISSVCDIMNNQQKSPMENLASVNSRYLSLHRYSCWYGRKKNIILFQETQYKRLPQSDRLWFYQLCTEIGMNIPSTKSVDMFGEYKAGIEGLGVHCQDIFGPEFNQQTIDDGVEETNIEFGALAMKSTSQVVFVEGSLDPWRSAGAPENDKFAQYQLISINGSSHRADLIKPYHSNANWNNAIRKISDTLKSWIV